ncbi:MAG: hypothetical protein ABIN95_05830 [Mucilaginibacter sp.]
MFDELVRYKNHGHFFLKQTDHLSNACNAPTNKSGIYLVYALQGGKINLIYIGRSGKMNNDGTIFVRKAGLGGLKDRIVNGHQFGKIPRKKSWLNQILLEKIEALDIYWYATHDENTNDCPIEIEKILLSKYFNLYGTLPKWNKIG